MNPTLATSFIENHSTKTHEENKLERKAEAVLGGLTSRPVVTDSCGANQKRIKMQSYSKKF
eukprot:352834-Chlamydomonas_euryale.AAC.9